MLSPPGGPIMMMKLSLMDLNFSSARSEDTLSHALPRTRVGSFEWM